MRISKPSAGSLLVGFVVLVLAGVPASAELIEDRELNYVLELPPGWSRLPRTDGWSEYGIVVGGIRQLDTLKDGSKATGQGGMVHLAISEAPEGKDIDAVAEDPAVRGFLMNRFSKDPSGWPAIDVVPDLWDGGVHVRILRASGEAPNLKAESAPARAVMMVMIVKGRLYRLRMYAWPSEYDHEGMKDDLDVIEMNFEIPDTKEEAPRGDGAPPPDEEGGEEGSAQGDEAEEKVFEDLELGWRITKPVGIRSSDWDKEKYADAVAWFSKSDAVGSYQVIFYVIPRGRRNEQNVQIPDTNLREWGLDSWWRRFHLDHGAGPIWTYKWPRRSKSFITVPDFEKQKVVAAEPSKRPKDPTEVDARELLKKLKVVEKVKNQKVGEEKTIEAYRGVLGGKRSGVGDEVVLRYLWGTPRLTCMIAVSLARGGMKKWQKEIQALLESVEMTGRR